ncbi:MAG: hypothetical protein JSR17_08145 [Proteobacteria bacterium]|nr:hypothetical protein [Pseudomonadota bacterium]
MKIKALLILILSVFYISAFANANPGGSPEGMQSMEGMQHMMPPKESIDACNGKAKDDACSFTGPGGRNMEGSCFNGPDGKGVMACAPKPPKEAMDACTGKKEGDSCSFTGMNSMNIEGSCFKTPHGDVVCRPAKMPMPEQDKMGK